MSHLYVWKPSVAFADRAEDRFAATLEHQRLRYAAAYRRDVRARAHRIGELWIGQLSVDEGVLGWSSWVEAGDLGVAWSGVCEEFLGRADAHSVASEVARTIFDRPVVAAEWQGAFAVVAWDRARADAAVLTSATQPQPLWQTRGPGGWAAGSRARPLLDLVGRESELDEVEASLFLSFGYLAGDGCLFQGVDRVPSRRKIVLRGGAEPYGEDYISIPEFLMRNDTRDLSFEATVEIAAERFRGRVERQLRHSTDPMLSLTGGRDSRCIAAALHAVGYAGPAQTGGPAVAPDVVVAAEVARILGFDHAHGESDTDMLTLMFDHIDRARTWTELTEGIETIRHAMHFPRFFRHPESIRDETLQTFNGLTPGLTIRSEGRWGRAATIARIGPALHAAGEAERRLDEIVARLERDVRELDGGPDEWTELFFWQSRALHWGQDNAAAKFGLTWWWTPLMDGTLVRASWWLPRDAKRSKRLLQAMTTRLAPQLEGVPYESRPRSALEMLWARVRRKLSLWLGAGGSDSFRVGSDWYSQWESFLFEREPKAWPRLIDEDHVRNVLDGNVNAHLLWSIATIELFADAHLGGSGGGSVTGPDEVAPTGDRMSSS